MTLGYPYSYGGPDIEGLLSERLLRDSTIYSVVFISGFLLATSHVAFADDFPIRPNFDIPVPVDAPVRAPAQLAVPPAHVPIAQRRQLLIAQLAAVSASCGTAVKCGKDQLSWIAAKGTEEVVKRPGTAATIGCIFVAGWCAGQVFDLGLRRVIIRN